MINNNDIIEIPVITYTEKEFEQFLDSVDSSEDNKEDLREGDDWKRLLSSEENKSEIIAPTIFPSRTLIHRNRIISASEGTTIQSALASPDKPIYDCTEVILEGNIKMTTILKLDDFKKLWLGN